MNQIIPEIPSLLCLRLKRLEKYKHVGGVLQIRPVMYTSMSGTFLDPLRQTGFLRGGDGAQREPESSGRWKGVGQGGQVKVSSYTNWPHTGLPGVTPQITVRFTHCRSM